MASARRSGFATTGWSSLVAESRRIAVLRGSPPRPPDKAERLAVRHVLDAFREVAGEVELRHR